MEVAAPRRNELELRHKTSQIQTTLRLRGVESVFKRLEPSVLERSYALTNSFVQDIHTVSTTVSARNSGGLTVKAHTKSAEVSE